MSSRALGPLLLVAGCGRVAFTSLDDDPRLQLHVPFETTFDDVAHGRPVTCMGACPAFEEGPSRVAASFDGTQCLVIPSAPELETQELTVSIWFRTSSTSLQSLFGKPLRGATGYNNSYQLWRAPNGLVVFSTVGTGTTAGTVTDSDWHHAAATYAAGEVRTYLDGALQMSTTVPLTSHDVDELLIGCDFDVGAPSGGWIGQLDDVRYYSRALGASEIAALAE